MSEAGTQLTAVGALESLRAVLSEKLAEFDQRIQSEILKLEDESLEVAEAMDKITVTDGIEYNELGERLKIAADFTERAKGFFDPWRLLFYKPYQAVLDRKASVLGTVEGSVKTAKNRMLTFDREEKQRRDNEARILQEKQRKEEEERKLALAAEAETAGLPEEAVQAIIETPSATPTVTAAVADYRPQGIGARKNWRAEIYDVGALIEAAAKDKSLRVYLLADESALNKAAKIYETALAIPGVRAVNQGSLAVRR